MRTWFGIRKCCALAVLALIVACARASSLPIVDLSFTRPTGEQTSTFKVEVVASPELRAKGLMFRRSVPDRTGMLFIFPKDDTYSFWMKNTFISLDMVFVASDWTVVGVLENIPPHSEEQRSVDAPSRYVVEFKAGTAQREGIVKGARMAINGALPPAS